MLKPYHKIQREILRDAQNYNADEFDFGPLDTAEQIDAAYQKLRDANSHWDFESELRSGEVETGLPAPYSRHYESKSVAIQTEEGDWVGWTYWYGGGKYGEPGSIDWMSDAYDLTCQEEEKVVVVRTFTVLE